MFWFDIPTKTQETENHSKEKNLNILHGGDDDSKIFVFHASYLSAVHSIVHDRDPSFKNCHLKQGEVGVTHVVECHEAVLPGEVHPETCFHIRYQIRISNLSILINALAENKTKNE